MISTRIQYELNKHSDEPTEIVLGQWVFDEFLKEREIEELRHFSKDEDLEYLGIKVTLSEIVKSNAIYIYRKDKFGVNNFFRSYLELGHSFKDATKAFSKMTIIAIVTQRYTSEEDFENNYLLLSGIEKKYYKPFIKMLKSGFDIKSAISTLKETFNF